MGVGRPLGTRLSQKTKDAISKKITGRSKSAETKKKISDGVKAAWGRLGMREDAGEIVALYHQADMRVKDIAAMYGICENYVYSLVKQLEGDDNG